VVDVTVSTTPNAPPLNASPLVSESTEKHKVLENVQSVVKQFIKGNGLKNVFQTFYLDGVSKGKFKTKGNISARDVAENSWLQLTETDKQEVANSFGLLLKPKN
jgi:hypothetical protein